MQVKCNLSQNKTCKDKMCPCYNNHTQKSSCDGGCDEHPEQLCTENGKQPNRCEDCGVVIQGSKSRKYCDVCKEKRKQIVSRRCQMVKAHRDTKVIELVEENEKLKAEIKNLKKLVKINGKPYIAWHSGFLSTKKST